ncbi:MAG: polysaccharide biosynthesis/export family protein [Gammaproteobacteria bacterium]|nr:polysaccharide biosynthesis/export family protein [Gammaproteobacteria bacterium]
MRRYLPLCLVVLLPLLPGCQTPGYHSIKEAAPADAAVAQVKIVPILPADLTAQAAGETAQAVAETVNSKRVDPEHTEYRLGAGDVVSVTVWDHPEFGDLTEEQDLNQVRVLRPTGQLVAADGTIFFPNAGRIHAAGRTTNEVSADITQKLSRYLKNPQVNVHVLTFRSQHVLVGGEVKAPGVIALTDIAPTLLQAIAEAGGPTPVADLEDVTLIRAGQARSVNLRRIMGSGQVEEDPFLRDGDVVNLSDTLSKRVHVIGEVRLPSTYPIQRGGMTLADALGVAGGIDPITANASMIMVLRREGDLTVAHVLDSRSPAGMVLAASYQLHPQDVVYVAPVRFTDYNRALLQLLPTLQAVWDLTFARQAAVSPHYH